MTAILTDPQWAMPTLLPDGSYDPTEPQSCAPDLNADGIVNILDFGILLVNYGCSGNNCVADINDDLTTNLDDFHALIVHWGTNGCE